MEMMSDKFWSTLILNDKLSMSDYLEMKKIFSTHFNKLQKSLKPITKNTKGFNCKYAKWEDLHSATFPQLIEQGFDIKFSLCGTHDAKYMKGILGHICGYHEEYNCPVVEEGNVQDPKVTGAMMTYYKRYMYIGILCLSTPEDDLDNLTTKEYRADPENGNKITTKQANFFNKLSADKNPADVEAILDACGIELIEDMKKSHFSAALKSLGYKNE